MSLPVGIAVYFICWWLVLFAVLPIGVHTQSDAGDVTPGTADSAPQIPYILRKMAAATVIAAALFGVVYVVVAWRLISLDKFPI